MSSISNELARQYPATNASHSARVVRMKDDMVQYIRPTLLLLVGAVGFVLMIACANVANLLLARSTARQREFAIRAALGAERWRVVRQLLTESVLLSLGAGLIGVLLARWGTSLVLAAAPGSLPRAAEIGIDPYVLLFTLVVSIVTGILFGLAPAFHGANANPQESLKEGARGAGGGRHRAEGIFVAVEIGLAVILLAGAGLMMQSVWRLLQVDPGFNPRHVLTMQVALSPTVMTSPPDIRLAYPQLLSRVASIPGVRSAAMTGILPLGEGDNEIPFWPGIRTPTSSRPDDVCGVLCRHAGLPQRDADPLAARTRCSRTGTPWPRPGWRSSMRSWRGTSFQVRTRSVDRSASWCWDRSRSSAWSGTSSSGGWIPTIRTRYVTRFTSPSCKYPTSS